MIAPKDFRAKSIINDHLFLYSDEEKYETKIINLQNEQWKQYWKHPSYHWNYFVSCKGRIKVVKPGGREELRSIYRSSDHIGYYDTLEKSRKSLPMLVASYFVPNPFEFKYVRRIVRDPCNNEASNLIWVADRRNPFDTVSGCAMSG